MKIFFPPEEVDYDKGHGRIEIRKIRSSTGLNDYLEFPYLEQVFRIVRITKTLEGEPKRKEIAYGVTSLSTSDASPKKLLSLSREHWHIENRLHWVRDVTFDEDRSQIRTNSGPRIMASFRNLVISLLRSNGFSNIAKALRYFSWNPVRSLEFFGI